MTLVEQLRAIRAKIESPENWTQGTDARNSFDERVTAINPGACKWCLRGATKAIPYGDTALDFLSIHSWNTYGKSVHLFNDTHTHDEVLKFLDHCVTQAEVM